MCYKIFKTNLKKFKIIFPKKFYLHILFLYEIIVVKNKKPLNVTTNLSFLTQILL